MELGAVGSLISAGGDMLLSVLGVLRDLIISMIPIDSTLALLAISILSAWLLTKVGFKDFTFRFVALVGILLFLLLSNI